MCVVYGNILNRTIFLRVFVSTKQLLLEILSASPVLRSYYMNKIIKTAEFTHIV